MTTYEYLAWKVSSHLDIALDLSDKRRRLLRIRFDHHASRMYKIHQQEALNALEELDRLFLLQKPEFK